MPFTNRELTPIVAGITEKLKQEFSNQRKMNPTPEFVTNIVDQLLQSAPYMPLTLQKLNENWRCITGNMGAMLVYIPQDEASQQQLLQILQVQIIALASAFASYREEDKAKKDSAYKKNNLLQHTYYYNTIDDSFWRDLYLIDLFSNHHHHNHHHRHQHNDCGDCNDCCGNSNNDNCNGEGALAVAGCIALGATAAATVGYLTAETLERCSEIGHGENVVENTTKLAGTGFFAWMGSVLGATFTFMNPILASIFLAISCGAFGMKVSKETVGCLNECTNQNSAIDADPRFCLSQREARTLQGKGYNVVVVNEAIRELGRVFEKNHPNGIFFWDEANKVRREQIKLLRQLKEGLSERGLMINGKLFDLMPSLQFTPVYAPPGYAPEQAQPGYPTYNETNYHEHNGAPVGSSLQELVGTRYQPLNFLQNQEPLVRDNIDTLSWRQPS